MSLPGWSICCHSTVQGATATCRNDAGKQYLYHLPSPCQICTCCISMSSSGQCQVHDF